MKSDKARQIHVVDERAQPSFILRLALATNLQRDICLNERQGPKQVFKSLDRVQSSDVKQPQDVAASRLVYRIDLRDIDAVSQNQRARVLDFLEALRSLLFAGHVHQHASRFTKRVTNSFPQSFA